MVLPYKLSHPQDMVRWQTQAVDMADKTPETIQRWIAARRSGLGHGIMKGETSVAEVVRHAGLTGCSLLWLFVAIAPGYALEPENADTEQQLQRTIEVQQEQLESQQQQLQELQRQVEELGERGKPPPIQRPAPETPSSPEESRVKQEESVFMKIMRDPYNKR